MTTTQVDKVFLVKGVLAILALATKFGDASGAEGRLQPDGSRKIVRQEEDWTYEDHWEEGEPFAGQIRISYCSNLVWIMFYHGTIAEGVPSEDIVGTLSFLRQSLQRAPAEFPCRGPECYQHGVRVYRNTWFGSIERFHGSEVIRDFRDPVFHCDYIGGLVKLRH